MTNDVKSDEAGGEVTRDEVNDLGWDCRLTGLERIEPDPEEDDPDDIYSVSFSVAGPNADAEVEITVVDAVDVEVVAVALDTLHGALMAWADLIQRRKAELRQILAES